MQHASAIFCRSLHVSLAQTCSMLEDPCGNHEQRHSATSTLSSCEPAVQAGHEGGVLAPRQALTCERKLMLLMGSAPQVDVFVLLCNKEHADKGGL